MNKPKVPNSKTETSGHKQSLEDESELEPLHPESSAKKDRKFVTLEATPVKKKKSVPPDSTAQRGKSPVSTSEEEKKKMNNKG